VSDLRAEVARFQALAKKRKGGLLTPEEEEDYRNLGRRLAAHKRSKGDGPGLRGLPLPGCDFFDDFPELYRRGMVGDGEQKPGPEGEAMIPGAIYCRGRVTLTDGRTLSGRVLWGPEPSVDGKTFSKRRTRIVLLAKDGGVLPGSGRRVVCEDGTVIEGHIASAVDSNFVDLIPTSGVPKGVARVILRSERLQEVKPWHQA